MQLFHHFSLCSKYRMVFYQTSFHVAPSVHFLLVFRIIQERVHILFSGQLFCWKLHKLLSSGYTRNIPKINFNTYPPLASPVGTENQRICRAFWFTGSVFGVLLPGVARFIQFIALPYTWLNTSFFIFKQPKTGGGGCHHTISSPIDQETDHSILYRIYSYHFVYFMYCTQ